MIASSRAIRDDDALKRRIAIAHGDGFRKLGSSGQQQLDVVERRSHQNKMSLCIAVQQ